MNHRAATFFIALAPAIALGACLPGEEAERAPAGAAGEAGQSARGGDAVSSNGETRRGPEIQALSERFGLSDADAVIAPTLYRAAADVGSSRLSVERRGGAVDHITVSGDVDPEAVLERPRAGLAFELTQDRTARLLDQPVIVTIIARTSTPFDAGDSRPALQAAWVEPDGSGSGWRTMNLTEDWQKTVFAYDRPQAASGTHIITLAPPRGQPVDIAAVAIRVQGALDTSDRGGDGG